MKRLKKQIKTMARLILMAFTVILLFTKCSSSGKPDNFDYGSVNDNLYTNNFFNCTVKLPENWVIQSKEQTEEITKMGRDLVVGEDEKLEAIIEASEINTANLLSAFEFEVGTSLLYNPNIMIIAENVANAPGIKNGSDYLFHSRRLLEQSQFKYDYISEDFEKEIINGITFYKMKAGMSYLAVDIKQVYYSTIKKGFSFNIIISYASDEQKKVLLESINSVVFEK